MGQHEKSEVWDFLDAVMKTAPIKYVHAYLIRKGMAKKSTKAFEADLFTLWFQLYRRKANPNSNPNPNPDPNPN